MAGIIPAALLLQQAFAADMNQNNSARAVIKQADSPVHKIQAEIDADRDKIIEETGAIKACQKKLKALEKDPDKAKTAQARQEMGREIDQRKAGISELKKGIKAKRDRIHTIVYGGVRPAKGDRK